MASPSSSFSSRTKTRNEYANDDALIFCKCNLRTQRSTIRKEKNYGRRFYECRKYPGEGHCGFFKWIDDEFPEQAKVVIHELLLKQKKLEEENSVMRSQMQDVFVAKHVLWQRSFRGDDMDLVKSHVTELKGYVLWTSKVVLVVVIGFVVACCVRF